MTAEPLRQAWPALKPVGAWDDAQTLDPKSERAPLVLVDSARLQRLIDVALEDLDSLSAMGAEAWSAAAPSKVVSARRFEDYSRFRGTEASIRLRLLIARSELDPQTSRRFMDGGAA